MQPRSIHDPFGPVETLQLGKATLAYRKAGQGPVVLFLHGFPLSGLTWRGVVPALAERFTCLAFDLIGFGGSTSRDDADFSSEGQARVMQAGLRELGVDSYALVGNDTGGWIARELALIDRDHVTALALMNTEIPGHRPPWIPLHQQLVRLPGSAAVFRLLLSWAWFRRSPMAFGGCFDDRSMIDAEFRDVFIRPLLMRPGALDDAFRFLKSMDFRRLDEFEQLHAQLTMPVSFLWAVNDPTFPVDRARAMAPQFPNVTAFHTMERGKLFAEEEFPDDVARGLLEALAEERRPQISQMAQI